MADDRKRRLRELRDRIRYIEAARQAGVFFEPDELRALGFTFAMDEDKNISGLVPADRKPSEAITDVESPAFKSLDRTTRRLAAVARGRLEFLSLPEDQRNALVRFGTQAWATFAKESIGGLFGEAAQLADPSHLGIETARARKGKEVAAARPGGPLPVEAEDPVMFGLDRNLYFKTRNQIRMMMGDEITGDDLAVGAGLQRRGTAGTFGQLGGTLASMGLALTMTGGLGPSAAKGFLGKTLVPNVGGRLTAGASGVGFIAGMFGVGIGPDEPESLTDRINIGLSNAAGILFLGTLFTGKPVGTVSTGLRRLTLSNAFKASSEADKIRLGWRLLNYAPRMTTGEMLRIGTIGAGLSYTAQRQAGVDPTTAMISATQEGLLWVGYDWGLSRLGNIARTLKIQSAASRNLGANLAALGFGAGLVGAGASQIPSLAESGDLNLMDAFLGFGIGAGIGAAVGVRGLMLRQRAARHVSNDLKRAFQQRLVGEQQVREILADPVAFAKRRDAVVTSIASIVPEDSLRKINAGDWDKVPAEDAAAVAQLLVHDSWREALYQSVDNAAAGAERAAARATAEAAKNAAGPIMDVPLESPVARLVTEQSALAAKLIAMDNRGVPVYSKEFLPLLARFLKNRLELKELNKTLTQPFVRDPAELVKVGDELLPRAVIEGRIRGIEASAVRANLLVPKELPAENAARLARVEAEVSKLDRASVDDLMRAYGEAKNLTPGEVRARMAVNAGSEGAAEWLKAQVADLRVGRAGRPPKATKIDIPDPNPAFASAETKARAEAELELALRNPADWTTVIKQINSWGKFRVARTPGGGFRITVPDVGTFEAADFRKALLKWLDTSKGTMAAVGPLTVPGFYNGVDDDTGHPQWGWLGTAAGLAALAAIGIVLPKGRPVSAEYLAMSLQRLGKAANKLGREALLALRSDGIPKIIVGDLDSVPGRATMRAGGGYRLFLLAHNHPPYKVAAEHGGLVLSPLRRIGFDLANVFPSPPDIGAIHALAEGGPPSIGIVLAPSERSFTVFSFSRQAADKFTSVEFYEKAKAQRRAFIARLEKEIAPEVLEERKRKVNAFGYADPPSESLIMALAAERLPGGVKELTTRFVNEALRPLGLNVKVGIEPRDLGQFLGHLLARERTIMTDELEAAFLDPVLAASDLLTYAANQAPIVRRQIAEALLGPEAARRAPRPTPRSPGLPEGVTADMIARAPADIRGAKEFAAANNLRLESSGGSGSLRFILRRQDGEVITSAPGLRQLWASAAAIERQRGAVPTETLLGFVAGTAAFYPGALIGGVLQEYLLGERDNTIGGALFGGALLGSLAAVIPPLIARRMRARLRDPNILKTFSLVRPKVENPLLASEAYTHAGFGKDELAFNTWIRFPLEAQVLHFATRLSDIREKAGVVTKRFAERAGDLKKHRTELVRRFSATLNKYTVFEVDAPTFERLTRDIRLTANSLGLSAIEAERAVHGYWNQVAVTPSARMNTFRVNLFKFSVPTAGPLFSARNLDEIRDALLSARVMLGPVPIPPSAFGGLTRASRIATRPSKESSMVRVLMRARNAASLSTASPNPAPEGIMTGPIGRMIRPSEGLRSTFESWAKRGDAFGEIGLRFFHLLNDTDSVIQREMDVLFARRNRIIRGLDTADLEKVRYVMEGGKGESAETWRAKLAGRRDDIITAADRMTELQKQLILRMGVRPGDLLENYFQRFYSQRTIAEMQQQGLLPGGEPLTLPTGIWIPTHKFFRALQRRQLKEPLGETLSFMESSDLYIHGAVRKYHVDNMVEALNAEEFVAFAKARPHTGKWITEWMSSIVGMPTEGQAQFQAIMEGVGLNIEHMAAQLGMGPDWARAFGEFARRNSDPRRIAKSIVGLEVIMKLGFNFISPMVNLTQLLVNTVPEVGLLNVLTGAATAAQGAIAERAPGVAGIVDPNGRGQAVLRIARNAGVLNQRYRDILDAAAAHPRWQSSEKYVADSLSLVRDAALFPFQLMELTNRYITVGAAEAAFVQTERVAASANPRLAARGRQLAEETVAGAAVGAGVGYYSPDERERTGERALAGAAIGAGVGAGFGLAGKTTAARTMERMSLDQKTRLTTLFPDARALVHDITPTREDFLQWSIQQVTEMTQFKYTRTARPKLLRGSLGQAYFALQSYTFNQAEFHGHRFFQFMESIANPGEIDTRFLKSLIMTAGAGAALTAVAGFTGSEHGLGYWMARIGFGILPFLSYNPETEQIQVNNPYDVIGGGPLADDMMAPARILVRLATDPKFRDDWPKHADNIARQWMVFMRQTDAAQDTVAEGLETLGAEGLAELVEENKLTRQLMTLTGNPMQTITGHTSIEGGRRREDDSDFGGMGDLGFD